MAVYGVYALYAVYGACAEYRAYAVCPVDSSACAVYSAYTLYTVHTPYIHIYALSAHRCPTHPQEHPPTAQGGGREAPYTLDTLFTLYKLQLMARHPSTPPTPRWRRGDDHWGWGGEGIDGPGAYIHIYVYTYRYVCIS